MGWFEVVYSSFITYSHRFITLQQLFTFRPADSHFRQLLRQCHSMFRVLRNFAFVWNVSESTGSRESWADAQRPEMIPAVLKSTCRVKGTHA
jgi:hypothetical protein